uniref:Neur_chan_LBD domain-containing protein n=1 Tax=Haemonchus placei TaxID=6290 RepID=A0A0N4W3J2_HAEPC
LVVLSDFIFAWNAPMLEGYLQICYSYECWVIMHESEPVQWYMKR